MRFLQSIYKIVIIFLLALFIIQGVEVFAQANTPAPAEEEEDDEEEEEKEVKGNSDSKVCTSVSECAEKKYDCGRCIEYLNEKKDEASSRAQSLSSEISAMDNQISLTEARISAARQQIQQLQGDIEIAQGKILGLETDIAATAEILVDRIAAVYQVGKMQPWEVFLTSESIHDVFNRLKYLRLVQIYDKKRVYAAEQARSDYDNQKAIFEDKESEAQALSDKLAEYNEQLESEKGAKANLLSVTRNDEARYQRLLAQAQAERAIVFGGGKETFMREVGEGDNIGSIASWSASPGCSSGAHLHFELSKSGSVQNPSNYLKDTSFSYAYPESQYSLYGTISPSGNLSWPINQPIRIHQGFGAQPNSFIYGAAGHTGIDMNSSSPTVKAVDDGKLYGGSYHCGGSFPGPLYYAKIEHSDGLVSWYLHMIPN